MSVCVCVCVASEVTIVMLSCKSSVLVLAGTSPLHKTMSDFPKLHSLTQHIQQYIDLERASLYLSPRAVFSPPTVRVR